MTREAIREAVLKALTSVAPEIDPASLNPADELRQQVDLDSMDFLNVMIALHASLDVDVPESDYGKLATLNRAVDYLASRLGVEKAAPGA
jgi:acyl carrier protein